MASVNDVVKNYQKTASHFAVMIVAPLGGAQQFEDVDVALIRLEFCTEIILHVNVVVNLWPLRILLESISQLMM